ncbi:MAG: SIS domain-containing protein [Desulfovibrio sp.]|nr:SIS domain-containing protein [Desulfovibrio sp.]
MEANGFLRDYFAEFHHAVEPAGIHDLLGTLRDAILQVQQAGGKLMLAGNGASASMASHFAVDFTKQGKVRAMPFTDPALITAYGNDYGYDRWVAKAVEHYGSKGDLAILISSSGRSPNIVNAARQARAMGIPVATLTGFAPDNPLKAEGDINLWADCKAYNIIESIHAFWLAATCDLLIGSSEYGVAG